MKRKVVLVTGGAGFIGSHLCEFLLNNGYYVICLDNLFTGSKENIKGSLDDSNFEFVRHDITYPVHIECDEIYNLACPASPVHYQYDPVKTIRTNVLGVTNMLDLSKAVGARLFQASTSEVYGNPNVSPQAESYLGYVNTLGPRSCYDEGKRVAETLMMDYHRQYKSDIKIARIFNTYGPKMAENDGRVISNFILQALNGGDITVYGDGKQTRSFCYVSDLILGLYKMMNSKDFLGPVNLGNPDGEMTISELASKVIELTGSRSKIVFKELPEDDPVHRKPDITLAKEKLGWKPEVNLSDGLNRTVRYFKENGALNGKKNI